MPKYLLYPQDLPIPQKGNIFLFRNKKNGAPHYKTWNDNTIKLDYQDGIYYIREKVEKIVNYTGEQFDILDTDEGIGITFYNQQTIVAAATGGGGLGRGSVISLISEFSGDSAWLLDGNTFTAEKYIGTNSNHRFPIRTNNIERAAFTTDSRLKVVTGFIIESVTADRVKITFDDGTPSMDLVVNSLNGDVNDLFLGAGFNLLSSTYGGTRVNMGVTSEASLGLILPSVGFRATETRIRSYGLNGYASQAAAAAAGLSTGDLWYTSGHATLPDFVLMRKS